MRKLFSFKLSLFAVVFGLFYGSLRADDYQTQIVGPFGGLNNYDSPIAIEASKAQDLLNVDISPGGKSVKKRSGYTTQFALSYPTSPVHGVYRFFDATGNENVLMASDCQLRGSVNGASPTVLRSSNTYGPTYQCVDYAGYAYCANTSRDIIYKTDGQTGSTLTTLVSTGTMLAVTPDRLVMAGFSDAPNRIDFSASGDFTKWVQPYVYATDPNQYTITAPGSKITHICYAFNRIMWFKDSSFGYILIDPTSLNWTVRTVSPDIGTLDNSSVYREGILYFRSQEGHFYMFDGNTATRMSREITPLIKQSATKILNAWSQSSQSDFNSGLIINLINNADGSLILGGSPFSGLRYQESSIGSGLYQSGLDVGSDFVRTFTSSSTITLKTLRMYPGDVNEGGSINLTTYFYSDNAGLPGTLMGSAAWSAFSIGHTGPYTADIDYSGSNVSLTANTTYWIRSKVTCTKGTGSYRCGIYGDQSANGPNNFHGNWGGPYLSSGIYSISLTGNNLYSTGTYLSQVKTLISTVTVWDSFLANYQNISVSSQTFYVRVASNSYTVNSSTPAWVNIAPGSIPSVSTGSYLQVRDDFSSDGSNSGTFYDFTWRWYEGTVSDKAYGQYFENAVWWSVQIGSVSSSNNMVIKYDLLNSGWLVYDLPIDGMYVKSNALYFGSSKGGYVYKYGDAQNDVGNPINAYWRSKTFFGDSPFLDKSFTELSFGAISQQNSSISLTLNINGVSASTDTWSLYKANSPTIKYNNCQPLKANGDVFDVKFGNNAADQPFEVFAGAVGFRSKPLKDTRQ